MNPGERHLIDDRHASDWGIKSRQLMETTTTFPRRGIALQRHSPLERNRCNSVSMFGTFRRKHVSLRAGIPSAHARFGICDPFISLRFTEYFSFSSLSRVSGSPRYVTPQFDPNPICGRAPSSDECLPVVSGTEYHALEEISIRRERSERVSVIFTETPTLISEILLRASPATWLTCLAALDSSAHPVACSLTCLHASTSFCLSAPFRSSFRFACMGFHTEAKKYLFTRATLIIKMHAEQSCTFFPYAPYMGWWWWCCCCCSRPASLPAVSCWSLQIIHHLHSACS